MYVIHAHVVICCSTEIFSSPSGRKHLQCACQVRELRGKFLSSPSFLSICSNSEPSSVGNWMSSDNVFARWISKGRKQILSSDGSHKKLKASNIIIKDYSRLWVCTIQNSNRTCLSLDYRFLYSPLPPHCCFWWELYTLS